MFGIAALHKRGQCIETYRSLIFFLALQVLALGLQAEPTKADTRPNIIVIFTDDQVFRSIGYHGSGVKTPHLDALAKDGVIFEQAFVASPICAASRASMMTGLYPQQHGLIALDQKGFNSFRKQSDMLLPSVLAKSGYTTAFYGKSHLGAPQSYGFQIGKEMREFDDKIAFELSQEFIKSQKDAEKPFFLWLAPRQPHVPLYPEQKWVDLYPIDSLQLPKNYLPTPKNLSLNNQGTPAKTYYRDSKYIKNRLNLPSGPPRDEKTMLEFIRTYYAVISHLDHQVGQLLQTLTKAGLKDETVVFFLSDNGYHLGSHGLGNKITMHEESVRVPMFVSGNGVAKGKSSAALVSSLDIYSTLIELAGEKASPSAMGKSLLPLLGDAEPSFRETVFSECVGVGGKPGEGHRMARNKRYKLILSDADEEFLFDLKEDPFEMKNCRDDPLKKEILEDLRPKLKNWMSSIGDRPYPKVK